MFMSRRVTGTSVEEMLFPAFRKVDFAGASAVRTIAQRLRQCWATTPVSNISGDAEVDVNKEITDQMRRLQGCTDDEVKELAYPDKDDAHTPFRELVYGFYNHVFWDVAGFLNDAAAGIGHPHPPNHAVLPLFYPGSGPDSGGGLAGIAEKLSGVPFLIIPAYIEPGVKVCISSAAWRMGALKGGDEAAAEEKQMVEDNEGLVFDATGSEELYNATEIGWVKADQDIDVTLGGETNRTGLAAVLVIGPLSLCETVSTGDS